MTRNEFIKACEKAGCTLRDGKVMFGDMEFGTYTVLGFDVTASVADTNLRHCWMYNQVDLNTFKVLLKDFTEGYMKSIQGTKDAKKD
jgi:hypothetical protein